MNAPSPRSRVAAPGPWLAVVIVAAAGLLLAACPSSPSQPLRIGLNPWPGYDFLYLAAEKGWIAEAGGHVEIVELTSLGDSRRAFERGQVDAFGGTPVELLLSRQGSDRRPRAFYVTDWSEGADQVLARPPASAMADLRGKRVGVEPASLDLLVLATALDRAGMGYDAVQRVAVSQAKLPGAIASGRIDAAVSYPPVAQTLRERFGMRPVFDTADAPRAVLDLFIADAGALKRRPEDFTAVVRAFHRAVRFARRHPHEAYRLMGRREGLSAEQVRSTLAGMHVLDLPAQGDLWRADGAVDRTLRRTGRILRDAGHLSASPAVADLIDPTVVQNAGSRP
ncbi:MAG TPA: ABC transporter substrate-binding protein [Gammaproteobacteria bacterium]|nr:ABC transporter substrate-binding protein [Gammaproteobacteria bacterium]